MFRKKRVLEVLVATLVLWLLSLHPAASPPSSRRQAAFYTYVPNVDSPRQLLRTVYSVEAAFNKRYQYDWVFAYYADHEMPAVVKSRLEKLCSGRAIFERIESPDYSLPESVDPKGLKDSLRHSALQSPFSKFLQYKLKNRFNTYGFQFLPSLLNYRYYCNVEVGTELACDIPYDFFKHIQSQRQIYGFANAPVDSNTITKKLAPLVQQFAESANDTLLMRYVFEDGYTGCSFDSNFEVADLDFFRSKEYAAVFRQVDETNGFFVDRWTDYHVKTLAISLLVPPNKLFWLDKTGFSGLLGRTTCPLEEEVRTENHCACDPANDYAFSSNSGLRRLFHLLDWPLPQSVPPTEETQLLPKYRNKLKSRTDAYPLTVEYQTKDPWFKEVFMAIPAHRKDTTS